MKQGYTTSQRDSSTRETSEKSQQNKTRRGRLPTLGHLDKSEFKFILNKSMKICHPAGRQARGLQISQNGLKVAETATLANANHHTKTYSFISTSTV